MPGSTQGVLDRLGQRGPNQIMYVPEDIQPAPETDSLRRPVALQPHLEPLGELEILSAVADEGVESPHIQ